MTLDLHTLETVRAEIYCQRKYSKVGTDERAIIHNNAIAKVLKYLDAEIAKAKNHE